MNREELKKHITNFRLNLPQGMKFAVMAESAAVLESSRPLECGYLMVAMEPAGHFWALRTYGDMETRQEGSWTGNSWLKAYACYNEEQVVEIDGVPCQYIPKTNPFQDDPMADRPVPSLEDYAPDHLLSGDMLGLGELLENPVESRSASKALLQNPVSLKNSPFSQPQAWKRDQLLMQEYFVRKLDLWQAELCFTTDVKKNRRIYNNLSLFNKVIYKRTYRKVEGGKERLVESMFHLHSIASRGGK